jgi:acetyl-CoA carboxylase biotin carboxyl carrier protein
VDSPWLDDLQQLIDLLDGTSIVELELNDGDVHIALRRGVAPLSSGPLRQPAVHEEPAGRHYVTAPLLGTFYRSASPGAEPFVQVGDQVELGQVVGLIEAMKIFNEIQAEAAGRVQAILAEDGAFVEADQRLIAIDTQAKEQGDQLE